MSGILTAIAIGSSNGIGIGTCREEFNTICHPFIPCIGNGSTSCKSNPIAFANWVCTGIGGNGGQGKYGYGYGISNCFTTFGRGYLGKYLIAICQR